MNESRKQVKARFGPDSRFELKPAPAAPFRALREGPFERLKKKLLVERLGVNGGGGNSSALRRAANEAAALAWITPYPALVFPTLFEELIEAAIVYARRQDEVRERSRELLAA